MISRLVNEHMETLIVLFLALFFIIKYVGRFIYKIALWILVISGSYILGRKAWNMAMGDRDVTLANILSAIQTCKDGRETK